MFEFAAKLMLGRQLQMEKGSIKLLEQNILFVPAEVLVEIIKIDEKFGRLVYKASLKASKKMSAEYKRRFNIKGRKFEDLLINLTELAGWGVMKVVLDDYKKCKAIFNIENSNIAITYGKSKEPVDHLARGFLAGGASIVFGKDVECLEIKCSTMGSPCCEFVVGEPSRLKKEFPSLYKKQVQSSR